MSVVIPFPIDKLSDDDKNEVLTAASCILDELGYMEMGHEVRARVVSRLRSACPECRAVLAKVGK